jgi:hypothetical protein
MNREPPATALRLAEHGIPVFPCRADKKPTTNRGFRDATTDLLAMRELWRRHSGPLIGVPTGPASRFDVLDIDPRHGGDQWLLEHQDKLPLTRVHRTRSGGEHWIFQHTPGVRNRQGKFNSGPIPGVDCRGEGGYIIWWPGFGGSIVNPAKAAPWPTWFLEELLPKPQTQTEQPHYTWAAVPGRNDPCRIIERQLAKVAAAPAGQRHERLRNAALFIGGVMAGSNLSIGNIEKLLLCAVLSAGGRDVDEKNAHATITWGLTQGAAKPLHIG